MFARLSQGNLDGMALQDISQLFSERTYTATASDARYGIERFLQQELRSQKIYCTLRDDYSKLDIRVGSPVLFEGVLIRERDVRDYVRSQFQCSLGNISVMLDV
jgi:hypothetical protein